SPPYWQRRDRGDSIRSNAPTDRQRFTITLEDHTEEDSEQSKALWARGATIEEWTLVQGSKPASLGAYVVWVCNVQTQRGGIIKIRKRYSEFEQLRKALVRTFPHSSAALPPLPPKSILSRFKPPFLEKRRVGLQYFLTCVLLNPEFSSAPVLKEFMF
ncbi:Phox-like protein, partial [Eremomyces bilateralis CBS 781.70]